MGEFTCTKLMVDNRDPDQCKRGNALTIKAENTKPERFCKKDYLGPVFPARSMGDMKVWYVNTEEDYLGKGRYKNRGQTALQPATEYSNSNACVLAKVSK